MGQWLQAGDLSFWLTEWLGCRGVQACRQTLKAQAPTQPERGPQRSQAEQPSQGATHQRNHGRAETP